MRPENFGKAKAYLEAIEKIDKVKMWPKESLGGYISPSTEIMLDSAIRSIMLDPEIKPVFIEFFNDLQIELKKALEGL